MTTVHSTYPSPGLPHPLGLFPSLPQVQISTSTHSLASAAVHSSQQNFRLPWQPSPSWRAHFRCQRVQGLGGDLTPIPAGHQGPQPHSLGVTQATLETPRPVAGGCPSVPREPPVTPETHGGWLISNPGAWKGPAFQFLCSQNLAPFPVILAGTSCFPHSPTE